MQTIRATATVGPDRRLVVQLPESVAEGQHRVLVVISDNEQPATEPTQRGASKGWTPEFAAKLLEEETARLDPAEIEREWLEFSKAPDQWIDADAFLSELNQASREKANG